MRWNGNPPATNASEQASAEAARLLRDALSEKPASPFRMTPHGLYWDSPDGDKSIWRSPPFEIVAQTRNAEGTDWGLFLRWYDPDNVEHEWGCPMPHSAGAPKRFGGPCSPAAWQSTIQHRERGVAASAGRRRRHRVDGQDLATAGENPGITANAVHRAGWAGARPRTWRTPPFSSS